MSGNKAAVLTAHADPISWKLEDRAIPTAVSGTVVIQVLHSPLVQYTKGHITGESFLKTSLPSVPGGNGVGRVHAIGPDTTAVVPGDLVLVDPTLTARDDPGSQLLLGFWEGVTPGAKKLGSGLYRDGLWQQYACLPVENVYKLDEARLCQELGYEIADLPLIQACAIAYGGLDDSGIKAGDTVIVAPSTGRFGGATVLTALAMGATVVAGGRRQNALDNLTEAMRGCEGLKTVLLTGDVVKDTEAFQKAVGTRGADVYLDWSPPQMAGSTPTYLTAAINALRFKGTACFMGGVPTEVKIPYLALVGKNLVIRGRFMNERAQMMQCIKLAESGRLLLGKKAGVHTNINIPVERMPEAVDEAAKHPGWGTNVCIAPNMYGGA